MKKEKEYQNGYEEGYKEGRLDEEAHQKSENRDFKLALFMVGLCVGALFFVTLTFIKGESEIEELGNAICEERYNMAFDGYNTGTKKLSCKPKEVIEEYDGIKVSLKENNQNDR